MVLLRRASFFEDADVVLADDFVVGAQRLVQPGVLDGDGRNACHGLHEVFFLIGEIALGGGVDAEDADGLAPHDERCGKHRGQPFGLGRRGVLEPAVAACIAQVYGLACQHFTVHAAFGDLDGALAHVPVGKTVGCACQQHLACTVEKPDGARLAVQCRCRLFRDLVENGSGVEA